MQSMDTTRLDIIVMSHHFRILQIMEVLHPQPYLLFIVKSHLLFLSDSAFQYWERHGEVSLKTRASGTSRSKTKQKSDSSKSDNKSSKGSSQSKQKNNNSGSTQGKGSTSEQKNSTTPDLCLKLRKDRKLTPQERQHCLDNKLCLFCGASGHVTKDCPKSTSASSKA